MLDEGMSNPDESLPPNVKLLRNLADDGLVNPDCLDLEVSCDQFERLDELFPPITCEHPSFVSGVVTNTAASRIQSVSRKYIDAVVVLSINDVTMYTSAYNLDAHYAAAASEEQSFKIVFPPDDTPLSRTAIWIKVSICLWTSFVAPH